MECYFVKRVGVRQDNGESIVNYAGKEDTEYDYSDLFTQNSMALRRILHYGFRTIPAAKRSWAYKTACNVSLVKVTVTEDFAILHEEV